MERKEKGIKNKRERERERERNWEKVDEGREEEEKNHETIGNRRK